MVDMDITLCTKGNDIGSKGLEQKLRQSHALEIYCRTLFKCVEKDKSVFSIEYPIERFESDGLPGVY